MKETPQKLSVEWRNVTLPAQPADSYLNFAVHIYNDQTFEFHYGPSKLNPNNAFGGGGPVVYAVMFTLDFQQTLEIHSVGGDPSNPTFISVNGQTASVNAFPDSGTVYRFEPYNLSLPGESGDHQLSFFPNPAQNTLYTNAEDLQTAQLYSLAGKELMEVKFDNGRADISMLPAGIYFLSAPTKEGRQVSRIVKGERLR